MLAAASLGSATEDMRLDLAKPQRIRTETVCMQMNGHALTAGAPGVCQRTGVPSGKPQPKFAGD